MAKPLRSSLVRIAPVQTVSAQTASVRSARRNVAPFGLQIDSWNETPTNLRFADDLLLLAQSQRDIEKMLNHLQIETSKLGLKLNAEKTKVLFVADAPRNWEVQLHGKK